MKLVALGSSFAAGPGIDPVQNRWAQRSERNYPHLVADALRAELCDATVAGATTATILHRPQWVLGRRFRPQVESVDARTDLVTVTAAGNDLGYLGAIMSTAIARRALTRPFGRMLRLGLSVPDPVLVETATAGLAEIVAAVTRRAPSARVILVGYLPVFDAEPTASALRWLTAAEITRFRQVADQLAGVYVAAATRSGAELVAPNAFEPGHGVGAPDPWVNGLQPRRSVGSSYHPNLAGMHAVAEAVLRTIRG